MINIKLCCFKDVLGSIILTAYYICQDKLQWLRSGYFTKIKQKRFGLIKKCRKCQGEFTEKPPKALSTLEEAFAKGGNSDKVC
jgi:hypothetical protein